MKNNSKVVKDREREKLSGANYTAHCEERVNKMNRGGECEEQLLLICTIDCVCVCVSVVVCECVFM